MSEAVKANMFPVATSLDGLYAILSDASGSLSRMTGARIPCVEDTSVTDANECVTLGIWAVPSTAQNIPPGTYRNVLISIPYKIRQDAGTLTVSQILLSHAATPGIYWRKMLNDKWSAWMQITTEMLT